VPSSLPTPRFGALDRAAHLRTSSDGIEALRAEAGYLPVWRNRSLVDRGDPPHPIALDAEAAAPLRALAEDEVFLGLVDGRAMFALRLPGGDDMPEHASLAVGAFNDLRGVGPQLDGQSVDLLAAARGLLYWHRHHRFCGSCGAKTHSGEVGYVRICEACDKRHFPRTDPAMMALIRHDDRILLARSARFPPSMYSILAGFVEPGESLEQSVAREVFEEVGLKVDNVRYVQSQAWPFPSSLMLGFAMDAEREDFKLDEQELVAARWVTRAELDQPDGFFYPPRFSLSGQLIRMFMRREI
jgi:NAD+ diphosphatase